MIASIAAFSSYFPNRVDYAIRNEVTDHIYYCRGVDIGYAHVLAPDERCGETRRGASLYDGDVF